MAAFRLIIPSSLFAEMVARAIAAAPLECCGLLAGQVVDRVGTVIEHFPLRNELASATAFRSDAREMFAAMKAMRASGTAVLAVYHSHPSSAPIPSRYDLAQNYSEEVMTLIMGLAMVEPEVCGWWLTANGYTVAEWALGH